eukprot:scaffold3968_cov36-Phaeocystis_antarctica.AAC.1
MARPGREEIARQVGSRSRLALGLLGDGIRGAVAPNGGVSQGSGTARHCLRVAASPKPSPAGQARPATSIHTCAPTVRPSSSSCSSFFLCATKEDLVFLCACGGKNISRSSGQVIS